MGSQDESGFTSTVGILHVDLHTEPGPNDPVGIPRRPFPDHTS